MTKRLALIFFVVPLAMFCPVPTHAQRGGGLVFAPIGRPGPSALRGTVAVNSSRAHRSHRRVFASGFAPYFYSDYEPETPEVPPPEIVMAPPAPAPAAPVKPADSVLLELRGDRWIRVTNFGASDSDPLASAQQTGSTSTLAATPAHPAALQPPAPALPKATLVFRDGHSEEIPKYVIVGRTLFTTADYWSTGSWTRKVEIADLDVPATLKLNQQRGTKFSLPSGPTEIIMRP